MTLDQLLALCDELVSLTRAGIPLDRGLRAWARDMPRQIASQARELAEGAEAGRPPEQLFATSATGYPKVCQALIQAGMRTGRLDRVLEQFCRTARRAADLRRLVMTAMLYPLLVLAIVGVLGVFVLVRLADQIATTAHVQRIESPDRVLALTTWADQVGHGMWIVAAALVVGFVVWYRVSHRGLRRQLGSARWWIGIPRAGRLMRLSRIAQFTDALSLLIDNQVPLTEALELSAQASGGRRLQREAQQLAAQLSEGQSPAAMVDRVAEIPPLLVWLFADRAASGNLLRGLEAARQQYHQRAEDLALWMQIYLPVLLTVGIGGTATLVYVLAVVVPWLGLLQQLGAPL